LVTRWVPAKGFRAVQFLLHLILLSQAFVAQASFGTGAFFSACISPAALRADGAAKRSPHLYNFAGDRWEGDRGAITRGAPRLMPRQPTVEG
jgi:hypothetical protein